MEKFFSVKGWERCFDKIGKDIVNWGRFSWSKAGKPCFDKNTRLRKELPVLVIFTL